MEVDWTASLVNPSLILLNRGMQDCFREHPDVYGSELEDDEEDHDDVPSPDSTSAAQSVSSTSKPSSHSPDAKASPSGEDEAAETARAKAASKQVHEQHEPESETEDLVPKSWHDGTTPGGEGK